MFRTEDLPERLEGTNRLWRGTYRGHPLDVRWDGENVGSGVFLNHVLHDAACDVDWIKWLAKLKFPMPARMARDLIEIGTEEWGHATRFSPRDYHDLRDKADAWVAKDRDAYRWWKTLSREEQADFARDAWLCSHGWRVEQDLWASVANGEKLLVTALQKTPAGRKIPGERPLTMAEQRERYDSKKKKAAKKKAKPPSRKGPEAMPERRFGHCKRCKVCLAYDTNEGCCTVCSRPLTPNPKGRWVDSPTFRYQLFIPRQEEKDWNKPPGAFWTSTLGTRDGGDTSDWDQWMRGNQPEWAHTKGVVLEVSSRAKVKHLRTRQEAEDFLNEYGTPGALSVAMGQLPRRESSFFGGGDWWGLMEVVPDWPRVVADFDALHLEGGDLAHPAFYGWDAESTAWFTTDPLTELEHIELPEAEPDDDYDGDDDEPADNPAPRRQRKRLSGGRLTKAENARLFRKLMKL